MTFLFHILKSITDFDYTKVMLVQFAFFSAYFLFSVPWSKIVNKIGYQKTMVVGLVTMESGRPSVRARCICSVVPAVVDWR